MSELDLNGCLLVLVDVRNLRALLVRRFFDRRFENLLGANCRLFLQLLYGGAIVGFRCLQPIDFGLQLFGPGHCCLGVETCVPARCALLCEVNGSLPLPFLATFPCGQELSSKARQFHFDCFGRALLERQLLLQLAKRAILLCACSALSAFARATAWKFALRFTARSFASSAAASCSLFTLRFRSATSLCRSLEYCSLIVSVAPSWRSSCCCMSRSSRSVFARATRSAVIRAVASIIASLASSRARRNRASWLLSSSIALADDSRKERSRVACSCALAACRSATACRLRRSRWLA